MTVVVTLLTGARLSVSVTPQDSVQDLKRKINALEGIEHTRQRLLLGQQELTTGTIGENGLHHESIIHLLITDMITEEAIIAAPGQVAP